MALPFNHNPKEMFTKRQFATLVTAIARLEGLIQGFHAPPKPRPARPPPKPTGHLDSPADG